MNSKALHFGLFVLRFGIGVVFVLYGYPKLSDGPDRWADMGERVMEPLGVEFAYAMWGFLSAAAQTIGGLFPGPAFGSPGVGTAWRHQSAEPSKRRPKERFSESGP